MYNYSLVFQVPFSDCQPAFNEVNCIVSLGLVFMHLFLAVVYATWDGATKQIFLCLQAQLNSAKQHDSRSAFSSRLRIQIRRDRIVEDAFASLSSLSEEALQGTVSFNLIMNMHPVSWIIMVMNKMAQNFI